MKKILFICSIVISFKAWSQPGTTVPKNATTPVQSTPVVKTKPPTSVNQSKGIALTVLGETVPCLKNQSIPCLQVKKEGNSEYEFTDDIEGFNFEYGYVYTILVKEIIKSPPITAEESPYKYKWIKTLSKTEAESINDNNAAFKETVTTSPSETIYTNGKTIGQTTIQTTSPLDRKWYLRKMKEAEGASIVTDDNIMWIEISTFRDRLDGFGACNNFAAVVKSDLNTTFGVSKLTTDYSKCGNKKIEDLFYSLLEKTDRFEIKNGRLILSKQWNYLLEFVADPNNKEEITSTYTPPTIVQTDNKVYATNEALKETDEIKSESDNKVTAMQSPVSDFNTKAENPVESKPEMDEKDREIAELKKQLAAQKTNDDKKTISSANNNSIEGTTNKTETIVNTSSVKSKEQLEQEKLEKEATELKKQLAEKKAKEEAEKAIALKQEESKKQVEAEKLKLQKLKEIEDLKKQLAEKNQEINSINSSEIKTSTTEIETEDNESQESIEKIKKVSDYIITTFIKNNSNNIPDPEFPLRPYYLDGNELKKLERGEANFALKKKGIYRGIDRQVQVMKEESPIQFLKGNTPRLFIAIDDEEIDPYDIIDLCRADNIGKGRRNFTYAGTKYGGRVKDVTGKIIQLEFKKIRKGLYEIILDDELKQGEYAFLPIFNNTQSLTTTNSVKSNCFGIVDPDK